MREDAIPKCPIRVRARGPGWLRLAAVRRGLVVATVAAAAGIVTATTPLGSLLEETFAATAFRSRGALPAPPGVAILTIDQASAAALGLPPNPRWPRSIHARLFEDLAGRGVAAIAVDIFFAAAGQADADAELGRAIRDAGNVILLQGLERRAQAPVGSQGAVTVESLIDPAPAFAPMAAGLAPFPLPKVPARVARFWTFTAGADAPTLPAVALMVASRDVIGRWVSLLSSEPALTELKEDAWAGPGVSASMERLHQLFRNDPKMVDRLRNRLAAADLEEAARRRLSALLSLHAGEQSRILNFRGPAGTVRIVRYADLLVGPPEQREAAANGLAGSVVFVGVAELGSVNQPDSYDTVFSRDDGINLSGVEIAATAFADLAEEASPRRPALGFLAVIAAALSLGAAAAGGLFVLLLGSVALFICSLGLGTGALAIYGLLLPAGTVVAAVLPAGLFSAIWRLRAEERRARHRLDRAVRQYLPDGVASTLSDGPMPISAHPLGTTYRRVCLATDIERFAAVAERLAPDELTDLLNEYFARLFAVVQRHGGIVTDLVGDGLMCVWDEMTMKRNAAAAVLDMRDAVKAFNLEHPETPLRTRFGLHAGPVRLGAVGGSGHFAATAVGDVANTASRLEELNKHLRTCILASEEAVMGVPDLILRPLGFFRLAGKQRAVRVVEILGRFGKDDSAEALAAVFADAFKHYEDRRWDEAVSAFSAILVDYPDDGPAAWFLRRVKELIVVPSAEPFVIRMDVK